MRNRKQHIIAEINITPLTDIFLVLLIIMMVVTPLLDFTGLSAALSSSETKPAASTSEDKALTVQITVDGPYKVGGQDVAPEALGEKLKTEAPSHKLGLLLEVDPTAPLERLTRVMDLCQSTGITNLSITETKPAN